jgi:hypothetical protein
MEGHSTEGDLGMLGGKLLQKGVGRLSNGAGEVSAVHLHDAHCLGEIVSKIWC